MSTLKETINTLGVINITPNSFSDPSKFQDSKILIDTLNSYKNKTNLIFDFGFESTAPMNSAITESAERERFNHFFESIKDVDLNGCNISFDTYRPSNYRYFEEQFKTRYINQTFIFNDVSGVLDNELLEFLKTKKDQSNFYFLYSFTHIPSRDSVLNHMDYLVNEDIITLAVKKFTDAYKKLSDLGFKDKIIFDPCFGFSKTYEQNWELLNRFEEVVNCLDFDVPWLVGVSKKSFLRKSLPESHDPYAESEILHEKIIKNILIKKMGHVIFRVHDFDIVERAYAGL